MAIVLRQVNLVTPFRIAEGESIVFDRGKIAGVHNDDIQPRPGDAVYDLPGHYVLPGFIDLHVHGAFGYDFQDTDCDLDRIVENFLGHGTTGVLATLGVKHIQQFLEDIERLVDYCETYTGPRVLLGIHVEGPFLNPAMPGAMSAQHFIPPSLDVWEDIRRAGRGWIKLMTIAPEMPEAHKVMRNAALNNVVLSVGHSIATYEEIEEAIDNGLSQVTHIFNGMRPMHHRQPSVLLASLMKGEIKAQLIADAIHVHPAVIQLLYQLKGAGGILLISDAMRAAGLPDGSYRFLGQEITVKGGKACLPDGTIAGSTLPMDEAIRVIVNKAHLPLTDASRMASLNPARVLRLDHKKGILAVGKDADVVVLDPSLQVRMTVLNGSVVYDRETGAANAAASHGS